MKFSIIIPTYNSEKYIKSCLESIFNLNYPQNDYEIIVVDGGSKDRTLGILKDYKVKLVHSKNISISNSRNLAVKQAKGKNLVFIDSDCLADKGLLNIADKYLDKYACCGSFYKASKKHGWVAKTWLFIEGKKKGIVDWIPAGTLIVKKKIFLELNGFDEKLETQEDTDFCYRLARKGYKIYNVPEIASTHIGQTDNLKDFFKKEIWRGKGLIRGIKDHGFVKEELPSTILTVYHLFAFVFFIVSLFFIDYFIISLAAIILILPSFLLAIKKIIQTKKIIYLFNFWILTLLYQIARVVSIFRYNQFKEMF